MFNNNRTHLLLRHNWQTCIVFLHVLNSNQPFPSFRYLSRTHSTWVRLSLFLLTRPKLFICLSLFDVFSKLKLCLPFKSHWLPFKQGDPFGFPYLLSQHWMFIWPSSTCSNSTKELKKCRLWTSNVYNFLFLVISTINV